jgi:hypothetical protein
MQHEFHLYLTNIVQASIKNSHGQQIVTTTYPSIPNQFSAVYTGKWKQTGKEEEVTWTVMVSASCRGTRIRRQPGNGGGGGVHERRRRQITQSTAASRTGRCARGVLCVAGSGARGPTLSAGGLRRERERTWLVGLWGRWGWNQVLTEIVN